MVRACTQKRMWEPQLVIAKRLVDQFSAQKSFQMKTVKFFLQHKSVSAVHFSQTFSPFDSEKGKRTDGFGWTSRIRVAIWILDPLTKIRTLCLLATTAFSACPVTVFNLHAFRMNYGSDNWGCASSAGKVGQNIMSPIDNIYNGSWHEIIRSQHKLRTITQCCSSGGQTPQTQCELLRFQCEVCSQQKSAFAQSFVVRRPSREKRVLTFLLCSCLTPPPLVNEQMNPSGWQMAWLSQPTEAHTDLKPARRLQSEVQWNPHLHKKRKWNFGTWVSGWNRFPEFVTHTNLLQNCWVRCLWWVTGPKRLNTLACHPGWPRKFLNCICLPGWKWQEDLPLPKRRAFNDDTCNKTAFASSAGREKQTTVSCRKSQTKKKEFVNTIFSSSALVAHHPKIAEKIGAILKNAIRRMAGNYDKLWK